MILVDTNVICEPLRPSPEPNVCHWLDANGPAIAISAITLAELLFGIERLPPGRRRDALGRAASGLRQQLVGRILPFEEDAATEYSRLMVERRAQGRPLPLLDAQIAATARAHGLALATRNIRDFQDTGVELINPWI